ncbi:winged helix DNA-binding domain-containing protein, partial [Lentinula raphanica]
PVSRIPDGMDPKMYSLLGQLEYYLSPQNLASDFFLRQQAGFFLCAMDSHGWIPIPLIATFKRVRSITTDVADVRNALAVSSIVEVQGDMVRMKEGEWEQFVLPDAQASGVESSIHDFPQTSTSSDSTKEEEEEEEEEVVFVM